MPKNLDLAQYLAAQRDWSLKTFGPGMRKLGIIKHIQKEIAELEAANNRENDLEEWCDIAMLALDGAYRANFTPEQVCAQLRRKQAVNFSRQWPTPGPQDQPTQHITPANAKHWILLRDLPGIPAGRAAAEEPDGAVTFAYNGKCYRFSKYELRLRTDWFVEQKRLELINESTPVRCRQCGFKGFPDAKIILGIGPIYGCPACDAIVALLDPIEPKGSAL